MVDRRSKYSFLAKDRAPSTIGESARNPQDNFVTEFLKHAEQYDIKPLPVFKIKSNADARISNGAPRTHKLTENGKEKLPDCRINAYGIIQIASMLPNIGCLRDLNLDMNPNMQENYHLLCTPQGKYVDRNISFNFNWIIVTICNSLSLSYLSLRLCEISDEGVKKIANELKFRDPPNDPKLVTLCLANNHITDNGAAHVASMLRSNRSLQSLVLTGNRICDDGASLIIKELTMVTLTHIEIMDLRRRRFAELALQDEMRENEENKEIDKGTDEERSRKNNISGGRQTLTRRSKRSSRLNSFVKSKDEESVLQNLEKSLPKSEIILEDSKCHPFKTESYPIHGSIVATGNFHLQHLSLNYNHLTRETIKMLISCVYYQNYMMLGDATKGLLHVFLEGNEIVKENDDDWSTLVELLDIRRQDDYPINYEFRAFVPEESEVLRKNIKILTRSVESLDQ